MPALITAPGAPVAEDEALADDELDALDELDELLQASRIDPASGTDIPTTLARRMKSRRDSRPAASSSMMWLAISPWPWRRRPSRLWSIFLVTGSLPEMGRIHFAGSFAVRRAVCDSGSGDPARLRAGVVPSIRTRRWSACAGSGCGIRSRSAGWPRTGSHRSA